MLTMNQLSEMLKYGGAAAKPPEQSNTLGGLLSSPEQMLNNPLVMMGLGLLSENSKPFGGDPFGSIAKSMTGVAKSKKQRDAAEALEKLIKQQQPISPVTPPNANAFGPQQQAPPSAGPGAPVNGKGQLTRQMVWQMMMGR